MQEKVFGVRMFGLRVFFTVNVSGQYVLSDLYVVVHSMSPGAHHVALKVAFIQKVRFVF